MRAEHSTFKNNRRSAEFMWYRNINPMNKLEVANKSYFRDCTFITDTLHSDVHPFVGHVTMWGVNGIKFQGCRFENNIPVSTATKEKVLGSGIRSNDAGYTVEDYFTTHSSFKNLQQGVYMEKSSAPYKVKVKDAVFDKCVRGVRNEGVDLCEITGNTFNVGNLAALDINSEIPFTEGVLLRNSTGFRVERNSFSPAQYNGVSLPHYASGIRVEESGGHENTIYKNNFTGMHLGNYANGQNQNDSILSGLKYLCNQNTANATGFDFIVADSTVPARQGIKEWQGSQLSPSGNTFSVCGGSSLRNFTNFGIDLEYWHNNSSSPRPQCYSARITPKFTPQLNSCSDQLPICTACITINDFTNEHIAQKSAYNNYRQQYFSLIDGGDTPGVLGEIISATDRFVLQASLNNLAPNLSREAMSATIERMALLKDTGVYEVLRDNAEVVNEDIIGQFNDKALTVYNGHWFHQWMIDSIRIRMDSLTYRTYLLDTLLSHSEAKDYTAFRVMDLIIEDTLGLDLNFYREWLDSLGGLWSKQELVNTYLHEGRLDTIALLLDSLAVRIPVSDSLRFANYRSYISDYANWLDQDSSVMRLSPLHIESLNEHAATDDYLKGSMYARSILNFFLDSTYFTPIRLPEEVLPFMGKRDINENEKKPDAETGRPMEEKEISILKIYPNPASENVNIELIPSCENCILEIIDIYGRLLMKQAIHSHYKIDVSTKDWASGIYLVRVSEEGVKIKDGKFNIAK